MKKIIIIFLSLAILISVIWKFNIFDKTKILFLNKINYIVKKINYKNQINNTKEYLRSVIENYENKFNSYESLLTSYELLKKENDELRSQLDIPKSNYSVVYADILEKSSIYDYLIISKGKSNGIEIGDAVITYGIFIGTISEVKDNSSKVTLLSCMNYPVMVSTSQEYGQIDSYKDGYYYINDISGDVEINDHIVTGKFTEKIPSGLLIGIVEDIIYDNFELSKTLKVKCNRDYDFVGVITQ